MPKYLVDANLPFYFKLWHTDDYIHQFKIDPQASDKSIWDYALEHKLTIITKDSDFSNRILLTSPPPKVIHIKFGNKSMEDFHTIITNNWAEILSMSKKHKLVNVYDDRIEGIK